MVTGIDVAAIEALWGGPEDAAFRAVTEVYLGELKTLLASIRDHGGDRKALTRHAHSLRGASNNVGAVAIARAAGAIEHAGEGDDLAALIAALEQAVARDGPALAALAGLPA